MKVNEIITQKFVDSLKQNIIPWSKPWHTVGFQNAISGRRYSGINTLTLALLGRDSFFLTFNQANEIGAKVKKGSKSLPVVFCKPYEKKTNLAKGIIEDENKMGFAMRYYSVFNLADCELPEGFEPKGKVKQIEFVPIEACETLVTKQNALLEFVGSRACYSPKEHKIRMPSKESFKSVQEYYATLFHEFVHREAKELGEELNSSMEGESYSKEELVAEIGSNFLANACGLDISATFNNSIAYVQGWCKQLEKNPQLIISAASKAQKRVDSILKRAGLFVENEIAATI